MRAGKILVGRPVQRTLLISNPAAATLDWALTSPSDEQFSVDRFTGVLPAQTAGLPSQHAVTVTFTAEQQQSYDKIIEVVAKNGR